MSDLTLLKKIMLPFGGVTHDVGNGDGRQWYQVHLLHPETSPAALDVLTKAGFLYRASKRAILAVRPKAVAE